MRFLYRDIGKKKYVNGSYVVDDYFNINAIKESIKNILLTPIGTMPGDPEFGSKLNNVTFDIITDMTYVVVESFIKEALRDFEPRIIVDDVYIISAPEYNRVSVEIEFRYFNKKTGEIISTSTKVNVA